MRSFFIATMLLAFLASHAQNIAIGEDGSPPDSSAMLDVKSTKRGMLIPRMSTFQRHAISSPAKGLLVFDNDTNSFWFYSGISWMELRTTADQTNYWLPHQNGLYYNAARVGIGAIPHSTYPLYVRQPNLGGHSVAVFDADDPWHASIAIRNSVNNRQYALIVGGPSNLELKPNNFGIINTNLVK